MKYRPFADAMKFVEELNERGIRTCIVTSSSMIKMNNAFEQLPGFRDMFDGLITGDMVKNCKPDPEGYLMAADMLGLKPENCYVFEDSLQGIQAGINAGCKVVALTTTVARERIEELEANKIMDSFNGFGVDEMLALQITPY